MRRKKSLDHAGKLLFLFCKYYTMLNDGAKIRNSILMMNILMYEWWERSNKLSVLVLKAYPVYLSRRTNFPSSIFPSFT